MALAADLSARVRLLLPELLKFGIVGGIGTVVDLSGAALLHGKYHVGPLEAKAVSVTAATVITYLGSRFWTFKDRENQELKREAVLFIVLNVVGLAIAEAVVGLVTYVMSLHGQLEYNIASFLGTGCGTIFRYFAYKKWVFLPPGAESSAAPTAPAQRRVPDYPPWELDSAFLAPSAPAPGAGRAPAAPPVFPSVREPEREPAWDPALAPTMSWNAYLPQTAPLPQTPAVHSRDFSAQDFPAQDFAAAVFSAPTPPSARPAPAPARPAPARFPMSRSSGGGRHRKS